MTPAFLARRLASALITIWFIATAVFVLLRVTNDPIASLAGGGEATRQDVDAVRTRYGFDRSIPTQYAEFLTNIVQGRWSPSLRYQVNSMNVVLERVPATLRLASAALAIALLLAAPLGIVAALRRNSGADYLASTIAFAGFAVPGFWLGTMLVAFFAVQLRWFPTSGDRDASSLVLPAVTLAMFPLGQFTRLIRSEMLNVLGEDYLRTARAVGLRERTVILLHAVPNAALPFVTLLGLTTATLLGGAVVTESIFAWPGLGRLALQAALTRDFPLVEAAVVFFATVITAANFIVDILYSMLDPRVRYT